jgi:uncharacterized protein (DUF952 family)
MTTGLWAISYDVDTAHRREYEQWFHEVHIPEKLSRPGYMWAAHYALESDAGFLALFGGANTHVFLNPSPAQLASRQSAETKRFMGMRREPWACIFAEEVRVDGTEAAEHAANGTTGAIIELAAYNALNVGAEDDMGAWLAQERFPALSRLAGCIGARKLLASVGAYKHATLCEFASLASSERPDAPHAARWRDAGPWAARIDAQLEHAPRSTAVGRRIWPAMEPAQAPAQRAIYKVLRPMEWREMQELARFAGSQDDRRDGFIHFSTREQLIGTIERHFAGERNLVVLEVDAQRLGERLRWERSRGGALFPHLYAELPLSAVTRRVADDELSAAE